MFIDRVKLVATLKNLKNTIMQYIDHHFDMHNIYCPFGPKTNDSFMATVYECLVNAIKCYQNAV